MQPSVSLEMWHACNFCRDMAGCVHGGWLGRVRGWRGWDLVAGEQARLDLKLEKKKWNDDDDGAWQFEIR